jgi:hypothetical protein
MRLTGLFDISGNDLRAVLIASCRSCGAWSPSALRAYRALGYELADAAPLSLCEAGS